MSDTTPIRRIVEASDVTDEIVSAAREIFEGFYENQPSVDWDRYLGRIESWVPGIEFPEIICPAVEKLRRHVRRWRAEAQA